MIKLSTFLSKQQNKTYFSIQEESVFYKKYYKILPKYPTFKVYRHAKTPFEIIRANIVIRGFLSKKKIDKFLKKNIFLTKINKITVEKTIESAKIFAESLPKFIGKDDKKILIPFLPYNINDIYTNRLDYLLRSPYKKISKQFKYLMIDPFDYYGFELYDSEFSRLIRIDSSTNIAAFYDYDSTSLYFVDEQGRLENSFAFFDRNITKVDKTDMVNRLKPVARAYFDNDRELLLRTLIDNKLVSSKSIQEFVDSEDVENYDEQE